MSQNKRSPPGDSAILTPGPGARYSGGAAAVAGARAASVCPLDCPDRCSLAVEVRDGRVGRIGGTRLHPWTEGYICQKVARFGARVHGPERVLQPMRRVGPGPGRARFEPISWAAAMDLLVARMADARDRFGPESILPVWYGGSNGYLTGGGADQRLWNRLGVSRCLRTLCATNAGAAVRAVYGDLPGSALEDVDAADVAVLWGVNPAVSGIHLLPPLRRLQERGGRLVVVDPRATPLTRKADLHLPVLPGTDVPLALALVHVALADGLCDEAFLAAHCDGWEELAAEARRWAPSRAAATCGVDAADIPRLAHLYAAGAPAWIRCGWGMERNRNGSEGIRAVLMLPAVFGQFGRRGAGFAMSTSAGYRSDSAGWQGHSAARAINLSRLGAEIEAAEDPPIRVVYVYNCNPVATVPDQARVARALADPARFVAVHEQVWTDTCDLADLVLPATTFLEHKELSRSYASYVLQWSEPVVDPVGEARSNHAVLSELGARLGSPEDLDEDQLAAAVLAHIPGAPALEDLVAQRAVALPRLVQFLDVHPAGRVQLSPPPRYAPPPADADLPLALISPATAAAISSTLYEAEVDACLEVHPDDALPRGVADGQLVRVWNSWGEVEVRARLSRDTRPGVVVLPKGLWRRATHNGWTANALIPDHVDAAGLGACYNDARVELAPLAGDAPG
jgi:anaerobic selenocysteine-containing dehydrogenase